MAGSKQIPMPRVGSRSGVAPVPGGALAGRQARINWIVVSVLLGALALIGVALVAYSTTRGPGVGGDATIYLTSARNLLEGRGLGIYEPDGNFRPLPYTPPLFPLLLSAIGLLGVEGLAAARWLNALLFGGTVFLVGYAVSRLTCSSAFGLLSAVLMLLSPIILVRGYSWAMAEPVFLFCGFLGFFLVLAHIGKPHPRTLTAAAVACGLSLLARYIGAGFVGAAGLMLLLLGTKPWARRIRDTLVFAGISLLPTLVWLVWDVAMTHTVASRKVTSGLGLVAQLRSAWPSLRDVGLSWLLPSSWIDAPPYPHVLNTLILLGGTFAVLLLAGVVAWRLIAVRRLAAWLADDNVRLTAGLILLVVVYMGLALGVYVTTYPPITLDNRMFLPVHLAVLLLLVSLASLLMALEPARRWLKTILWIALLGFAASYAARGPRIIQQTHQDGLGYQVDAWQQSGAIQDVRALPANTPIVTNEATAIMFLAGRPTFALTETGSGIRSESFAAYGADDQDRAEQSFRKSGAALVLFSSIHDQLASMYGDRAQARLASLTLGLYCAYSGSDGAIYFYREPGK